MQLCMEATMKIIIYNIDGKHEELAHEWSKKTGNEIKIVHDLLTPETVELAKGFDGVAVSQVVKVDNAVYPKLREFGIKQIAQMSAGVDMYDLDAASENGIIVSNVASYSPESIAEFTVMVGMAVVRHLEQIRKNVKEYDFAWENPIRGKVIGQMKVAVIGTGRIGATTGRFVHGFGSEIVGYEIYPNEKLTSFLTYADSVEEAVKDADIVTLHMPATKENFHMFDAELFSKMKPGAILLNMGRGALVDTKALLDALDSGQLAGAGIDTYENEMPYVPKNLRGQEIDDPILEKLINHPKVIYTPHTAYFTDQALQAIVETALEAAVEVVETGDTNKRVN